MMNSSKGRLNHHFFTVHNLFNNTYQNIVSGNIIDTSMSPTFISLGLAFSLIFGTMYQTAYMSLPCEYIKGILYSLYPKTF
jgi:hypothetical protein